MAANDSRTRVTNQSLPLTLRKSCEGCADPEVAGNISTQAHTHKPVSKVKVSNSLDYEE